MRFCEKDFSHCYCLYHLTEQNKLLNLMTLNFELYVFCLRITQVKTRLKLDISRTNLAFWEGYSVEVNDVSWY